MATNQGESSTQDNVVKQFAQLPTTANAAGNESGVSDTAGLGAVAATYAGPTGNNGINGTASTENLSAKYKNGAEDIPEAGRNQYQ